MSRPRPIRNPLCSLLVILGAFATPSVIGQQVTYRFQAEVISAIDNVSGDLASMGGVFPGDLVTGYWTYSTAPVDLDPADPQRGLFAFVQPSNRFVSEVNGTTFMTDPAAVQMSVEVLNDFLESGQNRDELQISSTSNLDSAGLSNPPQYVGAVFRDSMVAPGFPPEFAAARGDAIPQRRFRGTGNRDTGPSLGWNELNHVYISEFDPFGPLATTGYSVVAIVTSLDACPSLEQASRSRLRNGSMAPDSDLTEVRGVVVVHYVAGTTRADLEPGGAGHPDPTPLIAWTEYRDFQFSSDAVGTWDEPWNYALNQNVISDDTTNPAPPLLALDLDITPDNGPVYGGQAAAWSIDFYDGSNQPGDLDGTRAHTVLFGAADATPIDARCHHELQPLGVDATGSVNRMRSKSVFHFPDSIQHNSVGPEVDIVQGMSWGGLAFDVPIPETRRVRPYVYQEFELTRSGHFDQNEAAPLFSDFESTTLASDQIVTAWISAPCRDDAVTIVTENQLGVEVISPKIAYRDGDVVEFEVMMASVSAATGFAAFLEFDETQLTFLAGSYTSSPFSLHIGSPITATSGRIDLDGSVDLVGPPVDGEAALATLTFEVAPGAAEARTHSDFEMPLHSRAR